MGGYQNYDPFWGNYPKYLVPNNNRDPKKGTIILTATYMDSRVLSSFCALRCIVFHFGTGGPAGFRGANGTPGNTNRHPLLASDGLRQARQEPKGFPVFLLRFCW